MVVVVVVIVVDILFMLQSYIYIYTPPSVIPNPSLCRQAMEISENDLEWRPRARTEEQLSLPFYGEKEKDGTGEQKYRNIFYCRYVSLIFTRFETNPHGRGFVFISRRRRCRLHIAVSIRRRQNGQLFPQ